MINTIIFLFITSALLTWVFSIVFKNPGPWNSFWVFLTVLLLAMFGFILWVPPLGPIWYDIAWVDALLFGLILALLLGATSEGRKKDIPLDDRGEVDLVRAAQSEISTGKVNGLFFWTFMFVMALIILFGLIHKMRIS